MPTSTKASSQKDPQSSTAATATTSQPILSVLSSTVIPLPRRTIGGIRDQILKVKKCNCKRSGCLKLYCECFNAGVYCNEACCCKDCKNLPFRGSFPESDQRMEMIQTILDRNQHAFRPKATNITASQRGDEARGKAASSPLQPHESRAKKTKMGCNCRKTKCLKKYCECFQAQLYCTATCRCNDCENVVGNAKREALISKVKKKEEEKESLALAAFAISGTENAEVPAVTNIGGVSANTVAMVSAGVAAAGVDVFLPASSYARPMLVGKEGRVVSEIAFGMVGRQEVGGVDEDVAPTPTKPEISVKSEDGSMKADARVEGEGTTGATDMDGEATPTRTGALQNSLETAKWDAATKEIESYHKVFKSVLEKMVPKIDSAHEGEDDPGGTTDMIVDATTETSTSDKTAATAHPAPPLPDGDEHSDDPFQAILETEVETSDANDTSTNPAPTPMEVDNCAGTPVEGPRDDKSESISQANIDEGGTVEGNAESTNKSSQDNEKIAGLGVADSSILAQEDTSSTEELSTIAKRTHEQIAQDTVKIIMNDLTVFKKRMKSACAASEKIVNDQITKWKQHEEKTSNSPDTQNSQPVEDNDANAGGEENNEETESVRIEQSIAASDLRCKEDFPINSETDKSEKNGSKMSEEAVRQLHAITAQDVVLYNELSRVIREQAFALAKKRKERGQEV